MREMLNEILSLGEFIEVARSPAATFEGGRSCHNGQQLKLLTEVEHK
jgi:hypothetical protein